MAEPPFAPDVAARMLAGEYLLPPGVVSSDSPTPTPVLLPAPSRPSVTPTPAPAPAPAPVAATVAPEAMLPKPNVDDASTAATEEEEEEEEPEGLEPPSAITSLAPPLPGKLNSSAGDRRCTGEAMPAKLRISLDAAALTLPTPPPMYGERWMRLPAPPVEVIIRGGVMWPGRMEGCCATLEEGEPFTLCMPTATGMGCMLLLANTMPPAFGTMWLLLLLLLLLEADPMEVAEEPGSEPTTLLYIPREETGWRGKAM